MATGQKTAPTEAPGRRRPWPLELYGTAVGKKYAMAISGIVLMGYVFLHMVGNLKLYLGAEHMDEYAEWLRHFGAPAAPESGALWGMRVLLLIATVVHVHAAYALTRMNTDARGGRKRYESRRDYVAADFASRTMRWTGVIVLLFIAFHLADLTFGSANPEFVYGDVYNNVVASFSRAPVAALYVIANLALGLHLYHGTWSLFQTMGWNRPRFNHWRRWFAIAFAVVIVAGNVSFPLAVQTGIVS